MGARGVLRIIEGKRLGFWCPGCEEMHVVGPSWTFDGNYDRPTFSPSVLVTGGHYIAGWLQQHNGRCYCNWNAVDGKAEPDPHFKCERCHSFVRGGQIQFLADCTHALVGKTFALQPFGQDA